jgi:hypothetical protein
MQCSSHYNSNTNSSLVFRYYKPCIETDTCLIIALYFVINILCYAPTFVFEVGRVA